MDIWDGLFPCTSPKEGMKLREQIIIPGEIWIQEMGSQSATPIKGMTEKLEAFHENFGKNLQFFKGDLTD